VAGERWFCQLIIPLHTDRTSVAEETEKLPAAGERERSVSRGSNMSNSTDFSERNFWGYATSLGASAAHE